MAKYYIAYGSNMDEEQMAYRCPMARLLGRTELEDYRLLFKGSKTGAYVTIEPEEGSQVPVLVWTIGKEDEKSLDRYEGYPVFYYKKDLEINLDGKRVTALVYIMDESREYGKPSERYYGVLERAYRKYDFPMEILTEAYEISGKIGEEIRKWYRRDYPGMPVRNGTAGTEGTPGQHEGRTEKGAFPEQENTESESPASGEGCPSIRGL